MSIELGDNQIPNLGIPVNDQLSNQELGVPALRKLIVTALQFLRDLFPLLDVGVLQRSLDDTDRIVLENEIFNPSTNHIEKLRDKLLSLFEWHMRLATQSLP